MRLNSKVFLSMSLSAVVVFSGCKSFEGSYGDPNQVQIVDDRWNPTDARLTVQKMITDMDNASWIANWRSDNNKKPADRPFLLVDDMENRTSELIDTKALFEDMRAQLLNEGKVRFIDGDMRARILDEYKYQQSGMVRQGSEKGPGKQFSADFFLSGAISSIVSKQGGTSSVQYQIEMKLVDIETGELVWSGIEKIRKNFERSGVGF